MWTVYLRLAQEWGMPPWQIEEMAPALWVDRWLAVEQAKADAEPSQAGGSVTQTGNVRRTRII